MKKTKALVVALLLLHSVKAQTDCDTFLRAINMVENPSNSTKPGRHGELGPYQFMASTWRQHTSLPFSQANDPKVAASVARIHYAWIVNQLSRNGFPATDYVIAKAWNMGVTATVRGRNASDYPRRVANLCGSFSPIASN